jgi:hypothetical protein
MLSANPFRAPAIRRDEGGAVGKVLLVRHAGEAITFHFLGIGLLLIFSPGQVMKLVFVRLTPIVIGRSKTSGTFNSRIAPLRKLLHHLSIVEMAAGCEVFTWNGVAGVAGARLR